MAQAPNTRIAEMLGALSQSSRLRIMQLAADEGPEGTGIELVETTLGPEGAAAGDMARALRCPPSTLSFHLKELTRCGLLRATQQGRYIRYAVRPTALSSLAEFIEALPHPAKRKAAAGKGEVPRPGRRKAAATGAARPDQQLSIFGD